MLKKSFKPSFRLVFGCWKVYPFQTTKAGVPPTQACLPFFLSLFSSKLDLYWKICALYAPCIWCKLWPVIFFFCVQTCCYCFLGWFQALSFFWGGGREFSGGLFLLLIGCFSSGHLSLRYFYARWPFVHMHVQFACIILMKAVGTCRSLHAVMRRLFEWIFKKFFLFSGHFVSYSVCI